MVNTRSSVSFDVCLYSYQKLYFVTYICILECDIGGRGIKLKSICSKVLYHQVKNLSVAREMVKSMAIEAQAAREANSMLVMQKGEGRSLEKIK